MKAALKESEQCIAQSRSPCPANDKLHFFQEIADSKIPFSEIYGCRKRAKKCRKNPEACQTFGYIDDATQIAALEFMNCLRA